MKQNIFLNSVLNRGAIVGFVMLCSHIFEQCAVVYGGSMTWYSIMGFEMVVSCALFVWMIHRFTKSYSLEVMDARQELKMFSFGQGFSYAVSVSVLAGVIVGLGRYILHSLIIGHTEYVQSMISSLQAVLKANPETAFRAKNSKGKVVIIQEDGWAPAGTEPTHMVLHFITSCGKAFYGGVGNTLWLDNVKVIM